MSQSGDNPTRWQNMRRMAWISLTAGLLFPVLVYFSDSKFLADIATAYYLFISAVVGAYMGFSTVGDMNAGNKKH